MMCSFMVYHGVLPSNSSNPAEQTASSLAELNVLSRAGAQTFNICMGEPDSARISTVASAAFQNIPKLLDR